MNYGGPGFSHSRMIIDLAPPNPPSHSPVSKLSLFLSLPVWRWSGLLTGGIDGVGEEPNHTTARKPGPLQIIQYSLGLWVTVIAWAGWWESYHL
jgi:hypothetical protein